MNKMVGLSLVAAVIIGIIPYARSGDAPSVPPGISARNWIPMGEQAGFVVTNRGNDLTKGLRSEANVLKGYFMLRRDGAWWRVEPGPSAGIYPTEYGTVK